MNSDSVRGSYGDGHPRHERKRVHERDDLAERRVRRRSDERGHDSYEPRRRKESPRRPEQGHSRSRSRSPDRHHHSHHRHRNSHRSHHAPKVHRKAIAPEELPCGARPLSRSADLAAFRPLFARYLDIQKQIAITALDEREIRGRWKSFVAKWNNAELAEGWYQPELYDDALMDAIEASNDGPEGEAYRDHLLNGEFTSRDLPSGSSMERTRSSVATKDIADNSTPRRKSEDGSQTQDTGTEEDDEDYGPSLPGQDDLRHDSGARKTGSQARSGPGIPALSDLTLRRELEASDRDEARSLLRQERKTDRALQKERLDELAPRADAGSRARQIEKKRETRNANASFAQAKSSNDMPELTDADLMGDGGGAAEYKRMKREAERKKSEREIRREEMDRARREEREDRAKEYRAREAQTVDMLREIAKSRFG